MLYSTTVQTASLNFDREKARPLSQDAPVSRGPRGKGICFIYKDHFLAISKDTGTYTTFEYLTSYFLLFTINVYFLSSSIVLGQSSLVPLFSQSTPTFLQLSLNSPVNV